MQKTDARPSGSASESKLHFLDYWRIIRVRFGIVVLAFLLVVITAAVATYFQPRKYQSSVTLELRSDTADTKVFRDSTNQSDPRLANTQLEIIRRKNVLYPVIDSLELKNRWATDGQPMSHEAAYYKLYGMMNVRQVRGTDLLELEVTSTDPKEAAELVNAIAKSYTDIKKSLQTNLQGVSIDAIDQNIQTLKAKVDELHNKMVQMLKDNPGIRIEGNEDSRTVSNPYDVQVSAQQAEEDKYKTQVAGLTSQLRQVEQLKGQELLRALSQLQIPDNTIQKVLPLYQDAVANEASLLQSGLGPNHPNVKSIRASKQVYETQLNEQVESIKHSLGIQLEIAQSTLDSVSKRLSALRGEATGSRATNNAYYQVKDEYIKAQNILDEAQKSKAQKSIENTMPMRPAISWDPAEPASAPSSPKVVLNMALGVLVGLLVGIGLAFFIEYLDTSVKTMDDVEAMLGVPVLAIIPKNIKLLHKCPSDVPDAEAYRILAHQHRIQPQERRRQYHFHGQRWPRRG